MRTTLMFPEQPRQESDALEFVAIVDGLIRGCLIAHEPTEAYVLKIDNWFGDRWVSFSHKLLGLAGVRSRNPAQPRVVPPFVPSRVIFEHLYRRTRNTALGYRPDDHAPLLHVVQNTEANARRKLERLCPDAALFWWSGNSKANGKGSVMAYLPSVEKHAAWYVGASLKSEWSVTDVKGTGRPEIDQLLAIGLGSSAP